MGVRNFRELGENLVKIAKALIENKDLIKLLYYDSPTVLLEPNVPASVKILHDLVRVVPNVESDDNTKSRIAIVYPTAKVSTENSEFVDIIIYVYVYIPIIQWLINSDDLRPFLIMSEIQKTLNQKTINGMGRIEGGDFDLDLLTSEMSGYVMRYHINVFT